MFSDGLQCANLELLTIRGTAKGPGQGFRIKLQTLAAVVTLDPP